MEEFSFYSIDFEGSLTSGIIEYGCVGISSTRGIFSTESHLCKNKSHIPVHESQCHGLYAEELKKQWDFSHFLPNFLHWRTQAFFCAHNASYENMLLQHYCPVVLHAHSLEHYTSSQWGPWLDTYILYKNFLKEENYTLQNLIETFQLQPILEKIAGKFCPSSRKKYHCALFDALACGLLLLYFIQRLSPQGISLHTLLQASNPKALTSNLQQLPLF